MGGGAVMSAGKKVFGRHNDMTGHLTGGIRGKLFGNKNMQGQKVGGAFRSTKNGVKNAGQKIGSVVLGKKDTNPYTRDKDGNSVANPNFGDRSGGIVGAVMGDKSNANDGRMGRVSVSQRVSKKFNTRNYVVVSYEMTEAYTNGKNVYHVSMVVKAKRMNEEGLLLMFLQDFPDITVTRII